MLWDKQNEGNSVLSIAFFVYLQHQFASIKTTIAVTLILCNAFLKQRLTFTFF